MSRRAYIIIAFVLAIAATIIGWSQTFASKTWPPSHTALWFPVNVITNVFGDEMMVLLSLIQFPIFATLFALGVQRWSVAFVSAALGFAYSLMVCIAFMIIRHS